MPSCSSTSPGGEIGSAVVPNPYVVHAHVYSDDGRTVDGAVAVVPERVIVFDALPWAAVADAYRPVLDPTGAAGLRPAVRFVLRRSEDQEVPSMHRICASAAVRPPAAGTAEPAAQAYETAGSGKGRLARPDGENGANWRLMTRSAL